MERLTHTRDTLLTRQEPKRLGAELSTPIRSIYEDSESIDATPAPVARHEIEKLAWSAANTDRVVSAGFLADPGRLPIEWMGERLGTDPDLIQWATFTPAMPQLLGDRLVSSVAAAGLVELPRNKSAMPTPSVPLVPLELSGCGALLPRVQSGELIEGGLALGSGLPMRALGRALDTLAGMTRLASPLSFTPGVNLAGVRSFGRPETPEIYIVALQKAVPSPAREEAAAGDIVIVETLLAAPDALVTSDSVVIEMEAAVKDVTLDVPILEGSRSESQTHDVPSLAGHVTMPRAAATVASANLRGLASQALPFVTALCQPLWNARLNDLDLAPAGPVPASRGLAAEPTSGHVTKQAELIPHTYYVEQTSVKFPLHDSQVAAPRPRFAPGARYQVEVSAGVLVSCADVTPATVALRPILAELPGEIRVVVEPEIAAVLPLAFQPAACAPEVFRPTAPQLEMTVAAAQTPMLVRAKLKPADGEIAPVPKRKVLGIEIWNPVASGDPKQVLTHAKDFWQNAPRDLKLLAIAIPVLLGLALNPSLPKVRVAAPATPTADMAKVKGAVGNGFSRQFQLVRRSVAARAAVALNEDFRTGLDDWQSRGDMSSGWSFDRNGFVKPGTLAVYKPSMQLGDYDAQFLGLIDKNALSFIARARDFDNYYVVKIKIVKPGPIPTIGVTRYAVINGKPQDRVDTIAPITARPDMLYRVGLNVTDDAFVLTLQGQMTDSWTEPRLKRGGIGFFAARGEESRLRWIQITHQYDMLGRLCAFLAPQNISN